MHLILSTHKPINAIYRDAQSGVTQYKVETPINLVHNLTTTISRIIPSDVAQREHLDSDGANGSERFGFLARISWRVVSPSMIQFGGQDIDSATVFRKENLTVYGRDHIFTVQDGKE
ncbi:hypothetical protein DFH09DRAFT_1322628 [Mycena vulgaris]|nr:hypothetical protein DFH09DRAFT_1322628 [Mycena vulgaris]